MVSDSGHRPFALTLLALGVVGVVGVLMATAGGAGLTADSVNYVRAARGLLDGDGFVVMRGLDYAGPVPMTMWPPLFPSLLAGCGSIGLDIESAARWINALLFGGNIVLVGLLLARHCASRTVGVVSALLMLTSSVVLSVHAMIWSEPSFIFLGLLGLWSLSVYLENPRRRGLLVASACCIALAVLDRYNGVALVGASGLALLILHRRPLARRLADACLHGAIACLPLLLWSLRTRGLGGEQVYGIPAAGYPRWDRLFASLGEAFTHWVWVFPTGLDAWLPWADAVLLGLALVALIGLVATAIGRPAVAARATDTRRTLVPLLAIFGICHLGILYAAEVLLYPAWTPGARHILPAGLAAFIILVASVHRLVRARDSRLARACLATLVVVVLTGHVARTAAHIDDAARHGLGYRADAWSSRRLVAHSRRIPEHVPIFSNEPHGLYVHSRRDARFLPVKRAQQRYEPNPRFAAQIDDMGRTLAERGGRILHFVKQGTVFPSVDELMRLLPLEIVKSFEDGVVLRLAGPTREPGEEQR